MVPGSLADAPPEMRDRFVAEMDDSLAFYGEMLEAGIPGEDARFVMPNATRTNLIMTANLRALIHMSGPAPVHDGPVGDPPAVPADPPRGVHRLAVPGLVPRAEVRAARATATRTATATSTAPFGRTRTTSWRRGPRRRPRRRPPVATCRRSERNASARRSGWVALVLAKIATVGFTLEAVVWPTSAQVQGQGHAHSVGRLPGRARWLVPIAWLRADRGRGYPIEADLALSVAAAHRRRGQLTRHLRRGAPR